MSALPGEHQWGGAVAGPCHGRQRGELQDLRWGGRWSQRVWWGTGYQSEERGQDSKTGRKGVKRGGSEEWQIWCLRRLCWRQGGWWLGPAKLKTDQQGCSGAITGETNVEGGSGTRAGNLARMSQGPHPEHPSRPFPLRVPGTTS